MYLCAKDVTRVEGWRNCSTWNNLGACGFVEKSWKKILDGVWSQGCLSEKRSVPRGTLGRAKLE